MMTTDSHNEATENKRRRQVDWEDPAVPAGNAPPLPAWPLWACAILWAGWTVFVWATAFA